MPLKEELALKRGARKHGFKPGSKRYNAYVYGTMAHNRAGWLGPDRILRENNMKVTIKEGIYPAHIIVLGLAVIALWLIFGNIERGGTMSNMYHTGTIPSFYDPNLNNESWRDYQSNAEYGAYAGSLKGLSD